MGSPFSASALERLRRSISTPHTTAAIRPKNTQPPTTPPAIAATFTPLPWELLSTLPAAENAPGGHCWFRDASDWMSVVSEPARTTCSPGGICPQSPGFPAPHVHPSQNTDLPERMA